MKNKLGKFLFLICMLLVPVSFANAECSDYFNVDNNCEEINHSVFVADENVNYNHQVNGISFLAGNNVSASNVSDYSFVAGNSVTYTGFTKNDLFVAGNIVNLSNSSDDKIVAGRDLFAVGNLVTINNDIQGNAFLAGNVITLKNVTINGDLNINADKLVIDSTAKVNGTINYNSDMTFENKDVLNANEMVSYENDIKNYSSSMTDSVMPWLMFLIMIIVFAFVINLMFPKLHDKLNEPNVDVKSEILSSLWGFVAMFIIPIAIIILLISIIGIEVAGFIGLCYLMLLMLSIVAASMILGNRVLNNLFHLNSNSYLNILFGVVILKLISIIPYVGEFIYFIAFIYGMGKLLELFKANIAKK